MEEITRLIFKRDLQVRKRITQIISFKGLVCYLWMCLACLGVARCEHPGPTYPATKGEVWPKPQREIKGSTVYTFNPTLFNFKIKHHNCTILANAIARYGAIIDEISINNHDYDLFVPLNSPPYLMELTVDLTKPCERHPYLEMDESYNLTISEKSVLRSNSIWGILRGLETFAQLFYYESDYKKVKLIKSTHIVDFPRYQHRGFLLDTARHFLSVDTILKHLDAMAMNKMNVFHWHIIDDNSFPLQSERLPELSQAGAFHNSMVYSKADLRKVLVHATGLAIRVLFEIDVPGHAASWKKAHPDIVIKCHTNKKLYTLNPVKKKTYVVLGQFLSEIQRWFPDYYLHLGGDEVNYNCWKTHPQIKKYLTKHKMSVNDLRAWFYKNVQSFLANGTNLVFWEDAIIKGMPLTNKTVSMVQIWKSYNAQYWVQKMKEVISQGSDLLFSSGWYLDVYVHSTFKSLYRADPRSLLYKSNVEDDRTLRRVRGGEACLWGETVDETNLFTASWPRASAVAEVLWSSRNLAEVPDVPHSRIEEHVCRMRRRGIPTEPLASGYCIV